LSEAESVLSLAESVSSYLKRKDFARRPHIALLGAERSSIGLSTSLLPEEFFDEHVEEEALQRLIPNITGDRVRLEKVSEPAQKEMAFSFFVRNAPPNFVLSVREAARLPSFPDHFRFCGGIHHQYQQAANAVPPILAEPLAKSMRKAFHGKGKGAR